MLSTSRCLILPLALHSVHTVPLRQLLAKRCVDGHSNAKLQLGLLVISHKFDYGLLTRCNIIRGPQYRFSNIGCIGPGACGRVVVKALRYYKPEGRGFETRLGAHIFSKFS
jgi:hypothetical protein